MRCSFCWLAIPKQHPRSKEPVGATPPAGPVAALVQAVARVDLAVCLERLDIPVGMAAVVMAAMVLAIPVSGAAV